MAAAHRGPSIVDSRKAADTARTGATMVAFGGSALIALAVLLAPIHSASVGAGSVLVTLGRWAVAGVCAATGAYLIRRRRTISVANLAIAALACLIALVLAEATLAVLGIDPLKRIVWVVPETASWWDVDAEAGGRFVPERYDGNWIINPSGFPDSGDFDPGKAAKISRRVLILGDSFAYGASASEQAMSFAELLETSLSAIAPTEVWNASIPGTGQRRHLRLLKRFAPELRPQVVLATLYRNDFEDNEYPLGQFYVFADGEWVHRYASAPDGAYVTLSPADAYRRAFAAQGVGDLLKLFRTPSLAAVALRTLEKRFGDASPDAGVPGNSATGNRATARTERLLEEMRAEANVYGALLVVLLVPDRQDLKQPTPEYQDARMLCERLRLPYIELLDVLSPDDYAPPPDTHWNDHGHAKVAEGLTGVIEGYLARAQVETNAPPPGASTP